MLGTLKASLQILASDLVEQFTDSDTERRPAQDVTEETFSVVNPGNPHSNQDKITLSLHVVPSEGDKDGVTYVVVVSWANTPESIFNKTFSSVEEAHQTYDSIKQQISRINGLLIDNKEQEARQESAKFLQDMDRLRSDSVATRAHVIEGKCKICGGKVSYQIPSEYTSSPFALAAYLRTISKYICRAQNEINGERVATQHIVLNGNMDANVSWDLSTWPRQNTIRYSL